MAAKKNEKAAMATAAELRDMSVEELRAKLAEQREELMTARVSSMPPRSLKRLPSSRPCAVRWLAFPPF